MHVTGRSGRTTTRPGPETKRRAVIGVAVAVVVVMYPIFQVTDALFGDAVDGYLGWGIGLAIYWLLFGVAFSGWAVGRRRMTVLARPRAPTVGVLLLVGVPLVFAAVGRVFLGGGGYERVSVWASTLLVATALGNGVFEEVFWRGVYLEQFGKHWGLQLVWPSLWFGVWHLAPGSVGSGGDGIIALMIGAVFFGLYLAFVARRTGSTWWPIVAHVGAGLIMVL